MSVKPVLYDSAHIAEGFYCKACGWPIVHACCNGEMANLPWDGWDYWGYCANKGCKHHAGEGWFQHDPSFVMRGPLAGP